MTPFVHSCTHLLIAFDSQPLTPFPTFGTRSLGVRLLVGAPPFSWTTTDHTRSINPLCPPLSGLRNFPHFPLSKATVQNHKTVKSQNKTNAEQPQSTCKNAHKTCKSHTKHVITRNIRVITVLERVKALNYTFMYCNYTLGFGFGSVRSGSTGLGSAWPDDI